MKQHNENMIFLVHFQPFVLKNSAEAYTKTPKKSEIKSK